MSAFIVSDSHIDAIVTFARHARISMRRMDDDGVPGAWVAVGDVDPSKIGQALLNANYLSVNYRYREKETPPKYRFHDFMGPLTALGVIKACNCFDYQACEVDTYEDSWAADFVDRVRKAAIYRLPGYDEATGWEYRENPARASRKGAVRC